jgi:hypothetical protein
MSPVRFRRTVLWQHADILSSITGLPGAFCVWLASSESDFLTGRLVWASWDGKELKAKSEIIKTTDLLTIKLSGWPSDSN